MRSSCIHNTESCVNAFIFIQKKKTGTVVPESVYVARFRDHIISQLLQNEPRSNGLPFSTVVKWFILTLAGGSAYL